MGKHTPGPWKWDGKPGESDLRYEGEPGDSDGCVIRYASYEGMWMSAYGQPGVDEANGRLIAASPDLLAELKWLVELFNESGMYDDEVFDNARAAIAKATGNDPL